MRLGLAITIIFMCGCSQKAPVSPRLTLESLDLSSDNLTFSTVSQRVDTHQVNACEVLGKLLHQSGDGDQFRFFSQLENDRNEPRGKVSTLHSPFLQMIVSEKAKVPTPEEALEIARETYENSNKSLGDDIDWAGAQCLYYRGFKPDEDFDSFLCDLAGFFGLSQNGARQQFFSQIYDTINNTLEDFFPGIFGNSQEVENSLYDKMIRRASVRENGNRISIENLNSETRGFMRAPYTFELLNDRQENLQGLDIGAAIVSGIQSSDESEQLCSITLGYQQFSQMIKIMGFKRPKFEQESSGDQFSRLLRFSDQQTQIEKVAQFGHFRNEDREAVILTSEQIKNYSTKNSLKVANHRDQFLRLNEYTQWLETIALNFVLTSPKALWVDKNSRNPIGDISDNDSDAFFPSEYHELSLGLLNILLQNLESQYLRKTNSQRAIASLGEPVAGIVLGDNVTWESGRSTLHIEQVIRLTDTVIDTSMALEAILDTPKDEIIELNSLYSDDFLPKIESAANRLKELHLGLAILSMNFLDSEDACYEAIDWEHQTGAQTLSAPCTNETLEKFKSTIIRLGERTRSKALIKRANQL